ncbi:peptidase associated/transthyretin-like domain-containing protein [Geomonas agri]|uniref:intradiol ring-cleavage dioxygenase n=1 Tax=Geomonas agri TaxID=2873702 RepID=UPI001CD23C94|nr:intradiol ring-cleavage dioxygenase [Geomonas agri]
MATSRHLLIPLFLLLVIHSASIRAFAGSCPPTPWDEIGPFYRPNTPVRDTIGKGYRLSGTVRSSADCSPITNARIEFWQAGPDGRYDDAYRATVYSDRKGRYRLQTFPAVPYANRPSHIHILVDVKGFEGLVTQHYPKRGAKGAQLDLVLVPEGKDVGKSGGRADDLIRPGKGSR